jgi:hypothetical protein
VTVTFGRLGRVFLIAGATALGLALISLVVFSGVARTSVSGSLGIIGVVGLSQGLVWTVLQHRMFGSVAMLRQVAATGVPTTATIVAVKSTASSIGASRSCDSI